MHRYLEAIVSSETGTQASPALRLAIRAIAAALAGMLLVTLLCQIPVVHRVDVGRFDAGYVRGFYDPERLDWPQARTYLNGSDGSARWTRAESYLLFPQAGLPAEVTLRLRGWRADGPPPQVRILVDGREAYSSVTTDEWQEIRLAVKQPSLKPEDVLITIRSDVAPISVGDPRPAGVLVDAAEYRTARPPLQPYLAPLAWGALAGALLALALADTQWDARKSWRRFFHAAARMDCRNAADRSCLSVAVSASASISLSVTWTHAWYLCGAWRRHNGAVRTGARGAAAAPAGCSGSGRHCGVDRSDSAGGAGSRNTVGSGGRERFPGVCDARR